MANFEHAEDDPKHVKMSGEIPAACTQVHTGEPSSAAGGDGDAVPVPSCTIPSFAAASELLSTPYSCLVMNTHRRHVALPPMYLNKKRTGIRGELEAELLKFSPSLKGVPLAYEHIRIVRQHGDIYDESGYIHMDVEANFIVFQPKKGQRLLGKVNKLGVSHVGCLVHGCFNASLPKPNLVPVETWRDAGPRIGEELEFEVTALDADTAGVLLIRGRLDRTRVQELMAMGESTELDVSAEQPDATDTKPNPETTEGSPDDTPKKKKKKKKDKVKEETALDDDTAGVLLIRGRLDRTRVQELMAMGESTELDVSAEQPDATDTKPSPETTEGSPDDTPKKKKKKKKDKVKEEVREEEVTPSLQQDSNTTADLNGAMDEANGNKASEKKKKKKKEKRVKVEEEEVQLSHKEVHGSDSSGYFSDKPSKKRKHETDSNVTAGFSEDPEQPKSKKKKKSKSDIEQFA